MVGEEQRRQDVISARVVADCAECVLRTYIGKSEALCATMVFNDPCNGSQIPWHVDDFTFGSTIIVYSFGEARPLLFRKVEPCTSEENATNPVGEEYVVQHDPSP